MRWNFWTSLQARTFSNNNYYLGDWVRKCFHIPGKHTKSQAHTIPRLCFFEKTNILPIDTKSFFDFQFLELKKRFPSQNFRFSKKRAKTDFFFFWKNSKMSFPSKFIKTRPIRSGSVLYRFGLIRGFSNFVELRETDITTPKTTKKCVSAEKPTKFRACGGHLPLYKNLIAPPADFVGGRRE